MKVLRVGIFYLVLIILQSPVWASSQAEPPWNPVSPEKGGPRNWEVVATTDPVILFQATNLDSEKVDTFSSGIILDNLDCTSVESQDWCYVQPIGGGPVGFVLAKYLKPAKSKDGTIAFGPDDSALRAGQQDFDATGKVPCAQYASQPMTQCEFAVSRAGSGYATVVVHREGQSDRVFFFRLGQVIGVSSSQADRAGDMSTTYKNELHHINVGDERYEIPDPVIFGG